MSAARAAAQQARTGWPAVFVAIAAAYLARMTGQPDVVLALPVAARTTAATRRTPAMVTNTVPLRLSAGAGQSMADLIGMAAAELRGAVAHQRLRYEDLLAELGLAGDDAGLIGAMINLFPQQRRLSFGDQLATEHNLSSGPAPDLTVTVVDQGADGASLCFDAHPGHFTPAQLASHRERFARFARAALSQPRAPLAELDLLEPQERGRIFAGWQGAHHPMPWASLPELFDRQAMATPGAPAVSQGRQQLTYRQLADQSTALARRLSAAGVGPGQHVAVAIPRSPLFILAALAIMRCGAAYLPVDISYPPSRVAQMLSDARPMLALAVPSARHLIPEGVPFLLLDAGPGFTSPDSPSRPLSGSPDPASTAYIIYTSGSSGRPKGVAVPHAGLVNLSLDCIDRLGLGPGGRVSHLLSPGFDTAAQEIWPALLSGAELVVYPHGDDDPAAFLARAGITHATIPPALLSTLPETGLTALRSVVYGGDTLDPGAVRRWATGRELRNQYGSTETSCTSTSSAPLTADGSAPIGRPVRNTQVYILDADLAPVPPGVIGEIYVAGPGLAHGYLGRPGLTGQVFLPCPFGPPGARMYRSGDLARHGADGQIEFVSRADEQVKVRGYRIEPGDIEAALAAVPGVEDAVVIARGHQAGDRTLVGYAAAQPGTVLEPAVLRAALARTLPDFMVPAALVVLDALPITANGKVDRAALPAPERDTGLRGRAARTELEQLLCDLFAEVLGVAAVGADESFFDRGGDSISAIRLAARAKESGLGLSVAEVMRHRTPEQLAVLARQADGPAAEPAGAGLGPVARTPALGWLARLAGPGGTGRVARFNQSVLVRTPAGADLASLATALQAVTDHHDALRLILSEDWGLTVSPPGTVRPEIRRVTGAGYEAEALAARDRLNPRQGAVLQAVWFDAGPAQAGRLLLVAHHIAVDAVSWRVLLPDLARAWQAIRVGTGPDLPPVGTSLRTWSARLAAAAPGRAAELPAWQRIVATPDPWLGDAPAEPSAALRRHRAIIPAAITGPLLTILPAQLRAGTDELLLTALARAVRRWRRERGGDGEAVLLDVETHGRAEEAPGPPACDLSRTVGWFTAIHPLSLDPGPDGTDPVRAVVRVKEQIRVQRGDGLGYALLHHITTADPPGGAPPRPQVAFNYLGRVAVGTSADWEPVDSHAPLVEVLDPAMPATHSVSVDAVSLDTPAGPELHVTVGWPDGLFTEPAIARLVGLWRDDLAALAAVAGRPHPGILAPSDAPLVAIGQEQLDRLQQAYPGLRDVLPLTPLQQGLLFHSLIDGQRGSAYHAQLALDFTGPLPAERLRGAAQLLLDRHPALRATFVHGDLPGPVQVIPARVTLPWAQADLSALPASQRGPAAKRLAEAERQRPFDLTDPPLLRMLLIRLGEDQHQLVISNHHLLWDGWSTPVLLDELFAALGGRPVPAPAPPPAQYLGWLARQDAAGARAGWQQALAGLAGPTILKPDAPAEPVPHVQVRVELDEAITSRLQEEMAGLGVTLSTVIEAAWGILLARATGHDDVVFGTSVSGRDVPVPGAERMVGMLTNTLPVRVQLRPGESVAGLLARLQDEQARLTVHHHVGLADIQRLAGHGPLFDTTVVCLNYPLDLAALRPGVEGLALTSLDARDGTHLPLRMAVIPGPRLRLWLGYRPDCCPPGEAQLLMEKFRLLLETMTGEPDRAVNEIDALTPAERAQMLAAWGGYGA
jgi:amino acid adenylation domain-containing protein/non-ribosomal peptide synthase protein (TIGR01720 family)